MSAIELGNSEEFAMEDYESIERAVLETPRGRWFLSEYARRTRESETASLLSALHRLETSLTASQDEIARRLSHALATSGDGKAPAPHPALERKPALNTQQMKFFRQDEDIFETPAAPARPLTQAASLASPPPAPRLAVKHLMDMVSAGHSAAPDLPAPPSFTEEAANPAAELPPKRRIVIIRHQPGEAIDVPLQSEYAENA